MLTSVGWSRPDWVMVGMPMDDGRVRLIASKELNYAELQVKIGHQDIFEGIAPVRAVVTSREILLTTDMRTFILIEADTYADAFSELFRQWSPERGRHPAIEPGLPQIERGRKELEP
jgi:hypothetical protein